MIHQTPLGFADEMRVGLRGMVRRVWGRRGVKVRQRLQLVYKWRYLFLAVDVEKGKVHWSWIDSMKAEMVGAAVVWDGAPSHRDQRVHGLGLPLIGLPPYSTELNPAERIFEEVRRWIEGKVYSIIEDKVEAVEAFLTELESDPDRVRTLCGWHWIKEAIQGLPMHLAT